MRKDWVEKTERECRIPNHTNVTRFYSRMPQGKHKQSTTNVEEGSGGLEGWKQDQNITREWCIWTGVSGKNPFPKEDRRRIDEDTSQTSVVKRNNTWERVLHPLDAVTSVPRKHNVKRESPSIKVQCQYIYTQIVEGWRAEGRNIFPGTKNQWMQTPEKIKRDKIIKSNDEPEKSRKREGNCMSNGMIVYDGICSLVVVATEFHGNRICRPKGWDDAVHFLFSSNLISLIFSVNFSSDS